MKLKSVSVAAAALLVGGTCGANANLLQNGSFEAPVVPVGAFSNFAVGSAAIPNWTVIGPAGTSMSIVSGSFSQNGVAFTAQDGAQWVDLTGFNVNSTEGVAQSVTTTPGDIYEVSYFIGNTTGGGIFGSTSHVNVLVNGVQTFSDVNSTVSPAAQNWQQFVHDFTATSATTVLGFTNGDPASDNDNGLDNIVLLDLGPGGVIVPPPPAGVPEPASLSVLGVSLIGLMRLRRRR